MELLGGRVSLDLREHLANVRDVLVDSLGAHGERREVLQLEHGEVLVDTGLAHAYGCLPRPFY